VLGAQVLAQVAGTEREQVGHLPALQIDDAEATAGLDAHGPPFAGRNVDTASVHTGLPDSGRRAEPR
jgi:hypothetical protein